MYIENNLNQSQKLCEIAAFYSHDEYRKYQEIIQNNIVEFTISDGMENNSQSDHFIESLRGNH